MIVRARRDLVVAGSIPPGQRAKTGRVRSVGSLPAGSGSHADFLIHPSAARSTAATRMKGPATNPTSPRMPARMSLARLPDRARGIAVTQRRGQESQQEDRAGTFRDLRFGGRPFDRADDHGRFLVQPGGQPDQVGAPSQGPDPAGDRWLRQHGFRRGGRFRRVAQGGLSRRDLAFQPRGAEGFDHGLSRCLDDLEFPVGAFPPGSIAAFRIPSQGTLGRSQVQFMSDQQGNDAVTVQPGTAIELAEDPRDLSGDTVGPFQLDAIRHGELESPQRGPDHHLVGKAEGDEGGGPAGTRPWQRERPGCGRRRGRRRLAPVQAHASWPLFAEGNEPPSLCREEGFDGRVIESSTTARCNPAGAPSRGRVRSWAVRRRRPSPRACDRA